MQEVRELTDLFDEIGGIGKDATHVLGCELEMWGGSYRGMGGMDGLMREVEGERMYSSAVFFCCMYFFFFFFVSVNRPP
jgi:hypothetical protein